MLRYTWLWYKLNANSAIKFWVKNNIITTNTYKKSAKSKRKPTN